MGLYIPRTKIKYIAGSLLGWPLDWMIPKCLDLVTGRSRQDEREEKRLDWNLE